MSRTNNTPSNNHAVIEIDEYNRLRDFYNTVQDGDHVRVVDSNKFVNHIYGNTKEFTKEILEANSKMERQLSDSRSKCRERRYELQDIQRELDRKESLLKFSNDSLDISMGIRDTYQKVIVTLITIIFGLILFIVV